MKPIDLSIQNCYSQTGIEGFPVVMWKYGTGKHKQTAYQIRLFQNGAEIYTTDKVLSNEQNYITLPYELEEQTEYVYQVRVWDGDGQDYESDQATFISGVKAWKGCWIGKRTTKPFIAKKTFVMEHIEKSVISVCVPGQFEVRLNGERISKNVYEGCQTDFHKHVHYQTYDMTPFLIIGENKLTIEVANGWYIGDDDRGKRYFYTMDKGYEAFGMCLALLAQLRIGNRYIVTDTDWEISASKTVLADIYGSEDMDYTKEYRWEKAVIVDGSQGEIIPFSYPPMIQKECYEPVSIDEKRMIFDFGQNMSSQFRLRIKGNRGQKVKVIPAEKLAANGDIEQTVDTYSILTLSGEEDIFEQKFSVNGARWYQLENVEASQVLEFQSYFVTSSAKPSGYFQCSDERLNKIFHLIESAIESNLNHLHTDCPTIEKLGWLEPNHLMARAVMYLKDVNTLWSKIAMDMRDAQYAEGEADMDNGAFPHEYEKGLIPSIAPRYARFLTDWKQGSFWDIIPWGSSIILAAYEQYVFYGNKQILEDNYESAKKYIYYLTRQYEDYNRLYHKSGKEKFICAGLGDWGIRQNEGESRENIETAFYYHDLITMASIAKILGKDDKEDFVKQAESVKELYNESLLVKEDGKVFYRAYDTGKKTQANQAIPLCFGLVPKAAEEGVADTLIELCDGQHLTCGEIGLVYILRALAKLDRNDIIFDMILQKDHPSYLRFVEQGETTLPEFWRDDARSRNHDMMGHVMEWFFAEVAGIKGSVGFQKVTIEPRCKELVDGFTCVYNSIRGKIRVEYDKEKGIKIEVPNNVSI